MSNYRFESSNSAKKVLDQKEQMACCCSVLPKHLSGCCLTGCCSSSCSSNRQNACSKALTKHIHQGCDEIYISQDRKSENLCKCTKKHFAVKNDRPTGLWRDVPAKKIGHSDATSVDKPTKVVKAFESAEDQPPASIYEGFQGSQQEVDSMNEQQMSNVCSGSSAPVVTELPVEFNKVSYSAMNVEDNKTAYNVPADEGSGVEKCGSSDEALDTIDCGEDPAVNGIVDHDKSDYSLPSQSFGDLTSKLKVQTSSKKERVRYLVHSDCIDHEKIKRRRALKAEKKTEQLKINKLDMSVPTGLSPIDSESPNCIKHLKRKFSSLDKSKAPSQPDTAMQKSSTRKKRLSLSSTEPPSLKGEDHHSITNFDNDESLRTLAISSGENQNVHTGQGFTKENIIHGDSEKPPKYVSLSHIAKSNNQKMDVADLVRPVVCGRSGIISNGGLNSQKRPPKFISLSLILERSKRCDINESGEKTKISSTSKMREILLEENGCCSESLFSKLHCEKEDSKRNGKDPTSDGEDPTSACVLHTNRGLCGNNEADEIIEIERDGGEDRKEVLYQQNRSKFREVRKCSLSKLLGQDKHAGELPHAPSPGENCCSLLNNAEDKPKTFASTTTNDSLVGA